MSIILVIEDDPEILEVTRALLNSAGYQVLHARHAEEGCRVALSRDDIDVVFTDVNMGHGVNGMALVEKLRAQGSHAAMIVVSGDIDPFSNCSHAHAALLRKPYGRRQLLSAIDEACAQLAATSLASGDPASAGELPHHDADPPLTKSVH